MNHVLRTLSESIQAEIRDASDWTVRGVKPVWRNPFEGKHLFIYPLPMRPGEYRNTGSIEQAHEILIEYVEGALEQARNLDRDDEAESEVRDIAEALMTWFLSHKTFGNEAEPEKSIHRMDFVELTTEPPNRELLVRYCQLRLVAYTRGRYGSAS